MGEQSAEGRFSRHLLLGAFVIGLLLFTAIDASQADISFFLNVFVVAPALLVITIASLIRAFIRRRHLRTVAAALAILWALGVGLFLYDGQHPFAIRETARWLIWSHQYKQEVLARPVLSKGDLQHIEWDASGLAGFASNTSYLVFDPSDTLAAAAQNKHAIKFDGVPCATRAVRRLEKHWYAILFYTDQSWGECH